MGTLRQLQPTDFNGHTSLLPWSLARASGLSALAATLGTPQGVRKLTAQTTKALQGANARHEVAPTDPGPPKKSDVRANELNEADLC
jgi:hypothetical protein